MSQNPDTTPAADASNPELTTAQLIRYRAVLVHHDTESITRVINKPGSPLQFLSELANQSFRGTAVDIQGNIEDMDIPDEKHGTLTQAAETAKDRLKAMPPTPENAITLHLLERIIKNSAAVVQLKQRQADEIRPVEEPETGKASAQQGHRTLDYLRNMGADLDLDDED